MQRIRTMKKTTSAPPSAPPPKGAIKMEGGNLSATYGDAAATAVWIVVVGR